MIARAALLAVVAASGAKAGQPLSQSLTDCGALHMLNAERLETLGAGDKAGAVDDWANRLLLRAIEQGEAEGIADPLTAMRDRFVETTDDWRHRGARALFSEDYRDWMAYCARLSDHLGIERP